MMSGACKVLKEANCSLVGGHTSEGAETAMGFSINGLVDPEKTLKKSGLRLGDKIILTKVSPALTALDSFRGAKFSWNSCCCCVQGLGTGAIFAADMRYKARGIWVKSAIQSMLVSNRYVQRCFLHEH